VPESPAIRRGGQSVLAAGGVNTIRVRLADYAVASGDAIIATLGLGSCVAIAIHDARSRVGGLAHVLLPNESMSRDRTNLAKFPATAVPLLLKEMRGLGARGPFTGKLIGGASMFAALLPIGGVNMGQRNVDAARRALVDAGVTIVAEDTGGGYGRSVYLHVGDGKVVVKSLVNGDRAL
jgi:chemotaxis protein CheD